MKRAFIVLNPVAGTSDAGTLREHIQQHFVAPDWQYELYTTTGEESIADIIRDALDAEPDICVAIGGDGTVSGVASGLVNTNVPLGIVPTGTGNALARALGIPLQAPQALELLTQEPFILHAYDAFQVGDRYFFLNVSMGASAQVISDTSRQDKRELGFLAYIKASIKAFLRLRTYRFELQVDKRHMRTRASEITVANRTTMGLSSLQVLPGSTADDNRISILVVHDRTLKAFLRLAWALLTGQQFDDSDVHIADVQAHVSMSAKHDVPVQGDGETIGQRSVSVRVVPKAIRIVVPPGT